MFIDSLSQQRITEKSKVFSCVICPMARIKIITSLTPYTDSSWKDFSFPQATLVGHGTAEIFSPYAVKDQRSKLANYAQIIIIGHCPCMRREVAVLLAFSS